MATPTISAISPTTGPAQGHWILKITGTNFRTRVVPAGPPVSRPSTVRVLINGRAALYAHATLATELTVLVPPTQQDPNAYPETFPAVDVAVTNMDDSGVAITGETVTAAGALTYERTQIGAPAAVPPLQQVVRSFLLRLRRNMWKGAVIRTHPDFSDGDLEYTSLATLPMVAVRVEMPRDLAWSQWDNEKVLKDTRALLGYRELYRPPRTYMPTFRLVIADEHQGVAHRMLDSILGDFIDHPQLDVPGDPRWSTDENGFPADIMEEPKTVAVVGNAGVEAFSLTIQVHGVPLMPNQPDSQIYDIAQVYLAMANTENPGIETEAVLVTY